MEVQVETMVQVILDLTDRPEEWASRSSGTQANMTGKKAAE